MKHGIIFSALFVCFVFGFCPIAHALKISPFKAAIEPKNKSKTQVFHVDNNSDEPTAVQISVLTWDQAADGSEINIESDDFAVFPAQIILKPHENRAVRVQWLGTRLPVNEKSYRVLVEQITTNLKDMPEQQTGVKFMLRFMAALYVTPENAKSDVRVAGYEIMPENTLRVDMENMGTAHTLLKKPSLALITPSGAPFVLTADNLKPIDGENVHAGKTRSFAITLPPDAPLQITDTRFSFDNGF